MENNKRMWFDTEEQKILTYQDLAEEYVLYMLDLAKEDDEELDWIRCHLDAYTFDSWIERMRTNFNGTIIEITNADKFMRRKTND